MVAAVLLDLFDQRGYVFLGGVTVHGVTSKTSDRAYS